MLVGPKGECYFLCTLYSIIYSIINNTTGKYCSCNMFHLNGLTVGFHPHTPSEYYNSYTRAQVHLNEYKLIQSSV